MPVIITYRYYQMLLLLCKVLDKKKSTHYCINTEMLEYNMIDISEGIDTNKTNYFLNIFFKF